MGHSAPGPVSSEPALHSQGHLLITTDKNPSWEINQDGGIEGRALTPSCENTRITTGCWKIIDRKTLDFTKEDTPRPRTEEKPQ